MLCIVPTLSSNEIGTLCYSSQLLLDAFRVPSKVALALTPLVVESSAVMVQRRRSSFVRILPDYIVGPPNLREGVIYIILAKKRTSI